MNHNHINLDELIDITENIMRKCNVPLRDTWLGLHGKNLDDFYSNGNKYYGDRRLQIVIKDDNEFANTSANKVYQIPKFEDRAYDSFQINIPTKFTYFKHPIVHELVHFLQKGTVDAEKSYIQFNGTNYLEYIAQQCEIEAHFAQLVFIIEYENHLLEKLSFADRNTLITLLKKNVGETILFAKVKDLI